MKTDLNIETTRPYLSLLLLDVAKGSAKDAEIALRDQILIALAISKSSTRRKLISRGQKKEGDLQIAYIHYLDITQPSWLAAEGSGIVDTINQLIVVCRLGSTLGLYFSDAAAKTVVFGAVEGGVDDVMKRFRAVSRPVLDGAFMGGKARTLWLSGIHRRTAVKADSKILSGVDLASALNPLDDQTYHYTAARTIKKLGSKEMPLGVAHGKASIWISTTKTWGDFCGAVQSILAEIQKIGGSARAAAFKMPFLAEPVNASSPKGKAFDITFVPPELLALNPGEVPQDVWKKAEKWAYGCEFTNIKSESDGIEAKAKLHQKDLGSVRLELDLTGGKPKVIVDGTKAANADDDDWNELVGLCANTRWLKIRFDSGEVLSDSQFYHMQFRDYPFEGWRFVNLDEKGAGYDPTKEKPLKGSAFDVTQIGKQDSLFCWIANNWFGYLDYASKHGYLFCDDGANEMADFIHLDTHPTDGGSPRLSLIHVKGSKSKDAEREISVSDYEVVCGQAVKNLRALENVNLEKLASAGAEKAVAGATWKDGAKEANRTKVINELKSLGHNYRRRVIVFQPRTTKTSLDAGKALLASGSTRMEANRLRQLHTLLLEAEMGCRALGADFHVLGSDI